MIKKPISIEKQAKKPIAKIRNGLVSASVWNNTGDKGDFLTVSIDISFKDSQGQWQKSNNLFVSDIPKLVAVLEETYKLTSVKVEKDGDE